jgi:predicted RecB family nuclease
MLIENGLLRLSASDLVGHVNCGYLTDRDLAVARGELKKPTVWDPVLEVLVERGAIHEQSYLDHLKAAGFQIDRIAGNAIDAISVAQTLDAMRSGAAVIAQGALQVSQWGGRLDILRRVERPSSFGSWSYEVIDTKLARETKGNTILQICLYSDLLADVQKRAPEYAYVVTPGSDFEPLAFRFADYAAYYRRVRTSLEQAVLLAGGGEEHYPEPKPHCDICRWRLQCDAKWRADDHLTLVARISKTQIGELARHGITTVSGLAALALPLPWKPDRGAVPSYERIREQARIQVLGRTDGKVVYEALTPLPGFGLSCLPAPSDGDIFLDFEGDPFVDEGGLEFLFGYAFRGESGEATYTADWAVSRVDEKAAFERFVDLVIARWEAYPELHIYHYAPYEPAALKRLMGRYATREDEIDRMLRAHLFVDLYSVVRHGIRASVESYSIKKLEPLYAFERTVGLPDASAVLAKVQASLELGDFEAIGQEERTAVEGYNRDDCLSAWKLRDWLETVRSALIAEGATIDRPPLSVGEASQELNDWQRKIAALINRLIHDIPVDRAGQTAEQHGRWLLAHVLDFHRREDKAVWWEYYRLSALSSEELLDERAGLSRLAFIEPVGGTVKAPIHRYQFPPQDTDLRGGEDLRSLGGARFGKVAAISLEDRTIDIKKRQDTANVHPDAAFAHTVIGAEELANSLVRIGEHVADHGLLGDGPYQAARDLLLVAAPRVGGTALREPDETVLAAAMRIAPHIECGILPVQGPPGAGKTHIGARMICTLTKAGRNIGITANSHKVIRNVLDEVLRAANELGVSVQCMQKLSEKEDDLQRLRFTTDNGKLLAAIGNGCQVAAGTAWLWARADAYQSVDTLFIDEAAQMSLANVLAVSQAAKSVVLLGDPRQLEQPMQGSHPEGCDVSALTHILGPHATIPADRGLFLEETWRLHPEICAFTSELFYESRLHSRPGLELQEIRSNGKISGSGLRYLPVVHEGNQSSSPEEADKIKELVVEILDSKATWIDREGKESPVGLNEILIIAPYNAQVFELQDRIPGGRIGTVDKFQGQEAPIVIYSITTSSYLDAPRGMEFLYSANRLNVASSRARAICLLVSSPSIFEAECRTPRQMQLANAFCRYLETAKVI